MKKLIIFVMFVTIITFSYSAFFTIDSRLKGTWKLEVYDSNSGIISNLLIEFTNNDADVCSVAGDWKQVRVLSLSSRQNSFFPDPSFNSFHQELSYQLNAGTLTIGLNNICDYEKNIIGNLVNSEASGIYKEWGWGQANQLGTFTIARTSNQQN